MNVRRTGALKLLAVRHLVEDQETFLANYSAVLAWRIYLVQSSDFVPDRTYDVLCLGICIDSIIYGRMLAVVMNPVRQLRRPGSMSLAPAERRH